MIRLNILVHLGENRMTDAITTATQSPKKQKSSLVVKVLEDGELVQLKWGDEKLDNSKDGPRLFVRKFRALVIFPDE